MIYVRELTPKVPRFDPIELARLTESIVCKRVGTRVARKYTHFKVVKFYGGVATGFVVGCNLRCFFCWSPPSRDYPERYGRFYTPEEVIDRLVKLMKSVGGDKVRISGGEPTISREHLVQVLECIEARSDVRLFILETNGILLGYDRSYVKELSRFRDKVVVRVSLKAGTPEKFSERTGAKSKYFELPFRAIRWLLDEGVETYVAVMTDPRLMTREERKMLFSLLTDIDPKLPLEVEEESIEFFPQTKRRLRLAGIEL